MTFASTAPARRVGEHAPDGVRLPAWVRDASDHVDLAALADVVVAADVAAAFYELSDNEEFESRLTRLLAEEGP
ncbi:MAG: hypothetical protein WBQ50_19730 [Nocardioides sp.]